MFGLEIPALLGAAKALPWKWIGVAAGMLAIVATAAGIYWHIENLQSELVKTSSELAEQRLLTAAEKARGDAIVQQHDVQIAHINELEAQRTAISTEVLGLRQQIQDLDIEKDIAGDDDKKADAAVDALRARSAELNRLLEHAAGNPQVRAGANPAGKAR